MSDEEDGSGGDHAVNKRAKVEMVSREKRMPPIYIPNTLYETVDNALLAAQFEFILRVQKETVTVGWSMLILKCKKVSFNKC